MYVYHVYTINKGIYESRGLYTSSIEAETKFRWLLNYFDCEAKSYDEFVESGEQRDLSDNGFELEIEMLMVV